MDIANMLIDVLERGGSDLHITVGLPPVMRLNGKLVQLMGETLTPKDTKEILYSIMSQDQRDALERSWEYDFAYAIPGRARFRVNVYYQRNSVGAAFRLIPAEIRGFRDLGLPAVLDEMCRKPRGFVVVTGPTGCGKSTTLAAMIDFINKTQNVHVMTIEDPIEYLHTHDRAMVNQREVGTDTKSFDNALKYVLRQDPDVILIGEMRDLETVSTALTAAETGHLVLATLHTQDAVQTIDRIIDVFPPHQQMQIRIQLAGSLQGVLSQQLLPTIDGTGRVPAVEVLIPTPAIRNLIREAKTHQIPTAMQTGTQYGMTTMDASLAELCRRGYITFEVATQRASDPSNLRTLLGKGR